jgi:hypothetical protein
VPDPHEQFVEMANPHSWFLTADNLYEQTIALYRLRGRSSITRIDYRTGITTRWDDTNKSVFLLGGFALENAIKAFLVYEPQLGFERETVKISPIAQTHFAQKQVQAYSIQESKCDSASL